MLIKGAKVRSPLGRALLALLAVAGVGALFYQQRQVLASLLRQPRPCGLGTGCVDLSPTLATAVMFGFDAVLVALAIWQLSAGRFFSGDARADEPGWQWRAGLALVGISAVAPRFLFPELKQLRWDETHMAWLAINAMLEGQLPLTGIDSSVHIPNPPGAVYLVAPALAPFLDQPGSPWAMLTLSGALGTATSLLCAWFVRRWFGSSRAGLAAGLAFALGFWPMFLGRRFWQQNLLPPFAVLLVDALLVLALKEDKRGLVWAFGWLALMVQLHYASLTLAPLVLVALWLARRKLTTMSLASAIAVAILLVTPFIWWEASFNTAFNDVRKALTLSEQPAVVDSSAAAYFLNLTSAGLVEQQIEPLSRRLESRPDNELGQAADHRIASLLQLPLKAAGAGTILVGAGLLTALALAVSQPPREVKLAASFCVAWALVPVLFLTRHSLEVSQFYLYQALPAVAILIGLGRDLPSIVRKSSAGLLRHGWRVSYFLLLWTHLLGSVLVLAVTLKVNQRLRTTHYDVPVGYLTQAGTAAYEAWRATNPAQPILIGAQERDIEKLRLALGPAVPAITFDDCREVPVPKGAAERMIYFLRDETPGAHYLAQHDQTVAIARVPRPGASAYRVLSVSTTATSAVRFADDERWDWPDCYERYVQQ